MATTEAIAQRIRVLLTPRGELEEKRLMGSLAFMVNGAMCCALRDGALLVRVPMAEREELLSLPHVTPMQVGARTMRGFVYVAPAGYRTDAALTAWLERGITAGAERSPKRPSKKPSKKAPPERTSKKAPPKKAAVKRKSAKRARRS